jgi:hypothetical protein
MCTKVYSDILPRFGVTSCLREYATSCFWACDILPRSGRDTLPSRVRDILSRTCITVRLYPGLSEYHYGLANRETHLHSFRLPARSSEQCLCGRRFGEGGNVQ